MIEEKAMVVGLEGNQAIIEIHRQNACQNCQMSKGCGTGSLGRLLGYSKQSLSIINEHNLQVGSQVIVGLPEKHFMYAGFLMYLFPLLTFFMFGVTSNIIFNETQWINVAASLLGLVVGLKITSVLSNNVFAGQLRAHFIRQEFPIEKGASFDARSNIL